MSSKPKASASPGRPRGTPRKGPRNKKWSSSSKKKRSSAFDGSVYFGTTVALETKRGDRYTSTVTSYNARRARWTATRRGGGGGAEEINHGQLLLGADAHSGPGGERRHVGRRVTRDNFDRARTPYHGRVDGVDAAEGLWHVKFDDGDEEELDLMELLFAMDLYDRLHGQGAFGGAAAAGGDEGADDSREGTASAEKRRRPSDGPSAEAGGETEVKATPKRRNFTAAVSFGVALLAVAVWFVRHASALAEAEQGRTLLPPPASYRGRRISLSFDDGKAP